MIDAIPFRFAGTVAAFLLLVGCTETIYYQAGTTTDAARRDEVECGRIALQQAPVEREAEFIPGDIFPGPIICDKNNNCRRGPPTVTPDRLVTRDVNEDLRALITRQCMADRGYQKLALPICSDAVASSVAPQITTTMPDLTNNACVIRRGAGNFQIVP
ncbi:hypothetical protein [Pseudooceanicola sp. LIPI14-2-Ac024]|uniref:hypothetical protein n=1 Tax=Pseudooceanicola sp. LIPI14-2-Ac024 TaxID=3344875 RepID=UPI0035CF900D